MVVHALPELARTGAIGADGIAISDPMTVQIAILNEEKRKAKAYQVDAKAAKDNKAKLYDRERDNSSPKVCRFGHVDIKTPNKNICNLTRASARVNPLASLFTCRGQKPLGHTSPSRRTPSTGGSSPTTAGVAMATTVVEEMATTVEATATNGSKKTATEATGGVEDGEAADQQKIMKRAS